MVLPSLMVFRIEAFDRKRSKHEVIHYLSGFELRVRARKKTFKSKFDSHIEYLNIKDRVYFWMRRESDSHHMENRNHVDQADWVSEGGGDGFASESGDGERSQEHGSEKMAVRLGVEWAALGGRSNLRLSLPHAELPLCDITKTTLLWQINREGRSFDIILAFTFGLEGICGINWN
jgi:hypothetical protein